MYNNTQSQDPLFIEENALLSYLFLSTAVYHHLPKMEALFLEAIWHRSARFGFNQYTYMTYRTLMEGGGHLYGAETGDANTWFKKRFPVYTEFSDRHFKRVRANLAKMGLITQAGEHKSDQSYWRISCYPRDYLGTDKRLILALSAAQTVAGYGILRDISTVTESLSRFKKL